MVRSALSTVRYRALLPTGAIAAVGSLAGFARVGRMTGTGRCRLHLQAGLAARSGALRRVTRKRAARRTQALPVACTGNSYGHPSSSRRPVAELPAAALEVSQEPLGHQLLGLIVRRLATLGKVAPDRRRHRAQGTAQVSQHRIAVVRRRP